MMRRITNVFTFILILFLLQHNPTTAYQESLSDSQQEVVNNALKKIWQALPQITTRDQHWELTPDRRHKVWSFKLSLAENGYRHNLTVLYNSKTNTIIRSREHLEEL